MIYAYNIVISTSFSCQKQTPLGCLKSLKNKFFCLFVDLLIQLLISMMMTYFPLVLVFLVSCK